MCRLKKFIIGENKKKSEFEQYKKLYSKYLNMDKQQFDFEYIKLKTEYEHKKNVMVVFIVAVVLSVITGIWSRFFEFMQTVFTYSSKNGQIDETIIIMSFVICAAVAVFATIIILCIIYMNDRYINDLRKCIMILDVIEGRERNIIYEWKWIYSTFKAEIINRV